MSTDWTELPSREEIEELVRRAQAVTRAREADPVQFMAACGVVLAWEALAESHLSPRYRLAVRTLAIAAQDLREREAQEI